MTAITTRRRMAPLARVEEGWTGTGTASACVAELRSLMRRAEDGFRRLNTDLWAIGDCLLRLRDVFGMELRQVRQLADENWSLGRLSELYLTAKVFPAGRRRKDATFHQHEMARKSAIYRLNGKKFEAADVLDLIVQQKVTRIKRVTRILATLAANAVHRQDRKRVGSLPGRNAAGLTERCLCKKWESVVADIPDGSIDCVLADPPYWLGGYYPASAPQNGLLYDCDNMDPGAAFQTVSGLFTLCLSKMAVGGVMLLFGAGGRPDDPRILEKARQSGWEWEHALTWVKTSDPVKRKVSPPPGTFLGSYAATTERIFVFKRQGDSAENHAPDQDRADVLFYDDVVRGAVRKMLAGKTRAGTVHVHEKPLELCLHLVRKHVPAGGLLFEPFGGTGPGCRAAIRLGKRRWIYCESNPTNYNNGCCRIVDELKTATGKTTRPSRRRG